MIGKVLPPNGALPVGATALLELTVSPSFTAEISFAPLIAQLKLNRTSRTDGTSSYSSGCC